MKGIIEGGWRAGGHQVGRQVVGGQEGGGRVEYIGITESAPHQLWIHLINILTAYSILWTRQIYIMQYRMHSRYTH